MDGCQRFLRYEVEVQLLLKGVWYWTGGLKNTPQDLGWIASAGEMRPCLLHGLWTLEKSHHKAYSRGCRSAGLDALRRSIT